MKTIALIDGFNFYHPIENFRRKTGTNYKWLNYHSLIESLMKTDPGLQQHALMLSKIYFFTAIAHHRGKASVLRHRAYINALKAFKIEVIKGNFKEKNRRCPSCKNPYTQHEEKETDVRIALKLYEAAVSDEYDACLLFSADNDLLPAIRLAKSHFPTKKIFLVTPPSATGFASMSSHCDGHIGIKIQRLKNHLLPKSLSYQGQVITNPYLIPVST